MEKRTAALSNLFTGGMGKNGGSQTARGERVPGVQIQGNVVLTKKRAGSVIKIGTKLDFWAGKKGRKNL